MNPFLIKVPEIKFIDKDISDEEKKNTQIGLWDKVIAGAENHEKKVQIDEQELPYLMDVYNRFHLNHTQRTTELRLTSYMADKIVGFILEEGLVRRHLIKLKKKGRPEIFYELTENALELLNLTPNNQGKGGFKHRLFQRIIKEYYEKKGIKVLVEAYIKGRLIDVLAGDLPIEVETGESDYIGNVIGNLKLFPKVVVVTGIDEIEKIKEGILRGVSEDLHDKITFHTIDFYLVDY